jgi:hypothetical protein
VVGKSEIVQGGDNLKLPDYPGEIDSLTQSYSNELKCVLTKLETTDLSLSKRRRLEKRAAQLETMIYNLAEHRKGVADREIPLPSLSELVVTRA